MNEIYRLAIGSPKDMQRCKRLIYKIIFFGFATAVYRSASIFDQMKRVNVLIRDVSTRRTV